MRSSFFGTFILLVVVVRKSLRLNSKPVADYTYMQFILVLSSFHLL